MKNGTFTPDANCLRNGCVALTSGLFFSDLRISFEIAVKIM